MQELAGLRGSTILLTGSDGMLGRAFTEVLRSLGDHVELHALPTRSWMSPMLRP